MYELYEYTHERLATSYISAYYFLVDTENKKASTFCTLNDRVATMVERISITNYKPYIYLGCISKSQLNMYLTLNPNMKIHELVNLLSSL